MNVCLGVYPLIMVAVLVEVNRTYTVPAELAETGNVTEA